MNTIPFPDIGQMALRYLDNKKDRVLTPQDIQTIASRMSYTVADVIGALSTHMGSEPGDVTMEYRRVDTGETVPAEEVIAKMDMWYCKQSLSIEEWTAWLASVRVVYLRRAIPMLQAA